MQKHRFPPPLIGNSIQSTSGSISNGITAPFNWGSVAFNITSDPSQATETDGTSNAYSLQANTNNFNCVLCSNGGPFAAISGVASSASQTGDQGWVQFTYQNIGSSQSLCIWSVDATIATAVSNKPYPSGSSGGYANEGIPGYHAKCAPVPSSPSGPLTGSGAVLGGSEVIGYITCPNPAANTGCLFQILGYLTQAGGWWGVSDTDLLGLSGQWFNLNGGLLGSGGGSKASFGNIQMQQVLHVYSCFVAPQDATGYFAQPCPPPTTPLGRLYELTASPFVYTNAAETNNLTNQPATFLCDPYDCGLWYNSTAP